MRKIALVAVAAALVLAACGDDSSGDTASTTIPAETSATTAAGVETTAAASTTPTSSTTPVTTAAPLPKPSVKIPAAAPTELKVTVLKEGTGIASATGDQVVVQYVGVRSKDGVEFDNSYDRGSPFTVDLGAGSVIKGWDQGLAGVKAGSQVQLDIPAALAYGDQAQGDVIGVNENLTFVIDVLAVIAPADATKEPVVVVKPSAVSELTTLDLTAGTGPEAKLGLTATFHYIFYRGDTGEKVFSSWSTSPAAIPLIPDGRLDGLINGIVGMKVGGRRQITALSAQVFGGAGEESLGIPPGADVVMVADLVALY